MKSLFFELGIVLSLENWFENENLPKLMLDPLFLTKPKLCSHTQASLSPSKGKMEQMGLKGLKYGVYIRVKSNKNIRINSRSFSLTTINSQIQYPPWRANNFGLPHRIELKYET